MKQAYLFILICLAAFVTQAQTVTATYTSAATWTVPAGVTTITVKVNGGAGGIGGQDCGVGCGFNAAGQIGTVTVTYAVSPGDVIGIYPGTKGGDGASNTTNTGGGTAGVNSFNTAYNGGAGGNTGASGASGAGGGGGAASLLYINGTVRVVAGGAGGGGGRANVSGSGTVGNNGISANGTLNTGGAGTQPGGDGGGGGGGGGGAYGSVGGGVYGVSGESAGYGGYRGNNSVAGGTAITNTVATSTSTGSIEVTSAAVGGTAAANQNVCTGTSPADITVTGYAGPIQWQSSTDNVFWGSISGATGPVLTSAQMGTITATRYYRVFITGTFSTYSTTVTATVISATAAVAPSGTGTSGSPYQITSLANLRWVSENTASWDKFFVQTANIDAAGTNHPCYNSGTGWSPIGNGTTAFTGNYNGGSFAISNLYINRPATANLGFFGVTSGTIQNLSLTSASITTSSPVANTNMGILAGQASGNITGVTVSGTVSGGTNNIGGLAGTSSATINNSSSSATVSGSNYTGGIAGRVTGGSLNAVYATGSVTGGTYAGGITGELSNASINNSYAWGAVSGTNRVGGAIGSKTGTGTVTNIYSTGAVTGTTNVGGLIGELVSGSSNAVNSFWDTQTSGRAASAGGATGKTTAEMKSWDTFYSAAWDLQCESGNGTTDTWGINSSSNNGYPFVRWQPFSTVCPTWTGTTSNNFNLGSNWSGGVVPSSGMDITFSPTASNDLVLTQNTTVGNINFNGSNRKLAIGAFDVTINGTVAGANTNNYIQTNGTGVVRKNIASGASFTFPVGNGSYTPATITNRNAAADNFTARIGDEAYQNGGSSGPVVAASRVRRTWFIGKQNANTAPGFDMTLNWNAGDVSAAMATPGIANHNGTGWYAPTGSTSSTTTSLTFTGYTGSLLPFSVQETAAILPVTMLSFTATKQVASALLDWSTATESNSSLFEVEHSIDGTNWYKIGSIAAAGNSTVIKHYRFIHNSPVAGTNFYRLLQRDLDGRSTFSKTVSVQFEAFRKTLTLYPNPVAGGTVNVVLTESKVVRIINNLGVVVMQKRLNAGTNQVSVRSLAKGMYVLLADDEHVAFIVQ